MPLLEEVFRQRPEREDIAQFLISDYRETGHPIDLTWALEPACSLSMRAVLERSWSMPSNPIPSSK